ncbi:DUF3267 domain-containing protein [Lysinibacillus sp. NPDC056959]|uniref:DUF3267 domain-containing protein n=1 Tax=Lysinibacillus sp. NPDC056959 TaxID=3345981 RepID=UPI00362ACB5D
MKLLNKLPQSDPNSHVELIDNGWIPMQEPKNLRSAILLSIPLMMIASMISIGVINIFSSISLNDFGFSEGAIIITINFSIILWIVLLMIIHELLHLMFIPNFMKSKKTFVGLTLFGAFVITEEEILKSRYIFITVAPFIILSIILPLILSVIGLLTTTLKFLVILNAMGSSVDLLNLLLIMKQVPNNATLTCNGPNTYWKKDQTEQIG